MDASAGAGDHAPAAPASAEVLWAAVPPDTDLLVTHAPPARHRDADDRGDPQGCEALRRALARVRPALHVCGHVHAGRGAESVRWGPATARDGACEERGTEAWDVGGARGARGVGRVDLTARRGRGSAPPPAPVPPPAGAGEGSEGATAPSPVEPAASDPDAVPAPADGGDGRGARRATCVVNAAVMATSWPYPRGPARFNQPVVVDLDLPVAGGDAAAPGG